MTVLHRPTPGWVSGSHYLLYALNYACTYRGAGVYVVVLKSLWPPHHTYGTIVVINLTGEFVLATEHCRRSVEAVEVVHGEDSIELAQELHKLTQLLFNR